jgi:hypothetical protein
MLRSDGTYNIYIIQHQWRKAGEWKMSDIGGFGSKPPMSMNAIGQCWQDTGVMGTYHLKDALAVLPDLRKRNPEHAFRVACVCISQGTTPVIDHI